MQNLDNLKRDDAFQIRKRRKTKIVLLAIFLFLSGIQSSFAQSASYNISSAANAGNPGGLNTETDALTTGWTILGGSVGPLSADQWSSTLSLPFSFNFFGTSVSALKMNQGGVLTFTTSAVSLPGPNVALPAVGLPDLSIALMWDDFTNTPPTGSGDQIYYKVFGSAPNRQLWLKYFSFEYGNPSLSFAYFSVVLEETTNKVYVVDMYNINATGTTTVGLQYSSTFAVQDAASPSIAHGTPTNGTPIADNDVWTFTPFSLSVCSSPPTPGTATILPATQVCPGATVSFDLTGNSVGTGQTYEWLNGPTPSGPWTPIGGVLTNPSFSTTVTSTSYWRCKVTCSSVSDTSIAVLSNVATLFPSGSYTINNLLPTGGINFNTIGEAINAISCGIAGPIIFDVVAGSGPYNEQVTIPQINGASASNTITINGNGASLIYSSANTNLREAILLNGADHFIIDSLNIDVSGGTYGWGIRLTNSADSNIISNCQINTFANSTSTNYAGIVMSSSATSATTSGDNGDGNLFDGNTIINGYYGITLVGSSTAPFAQSNRVVNNEIIDHYLYGIYAIYNENTEIRGNRIHHDSRSTATTMYGVYLTTSCSNVDVSENRVYNFFIGVPTSTSAGYGIYVLGDGSVGTENVLFNNIIYSFRGNGSQYGIYNSTGDFMQAYHNTISFDDIAATGGICYGIYQTGSVSSVDIRNNIISITRSGTGARYGLGYVTAGTYITSNNNDIYVVSGGSDSIGIYTTIPYTTLANWQTANGGSYDGSSVSIDPVFTNPASEDFTPTNSGVNSNGANVGIATDILGNARTLTSPDPGAYEWTPLGTDAGITWISPVIPVSLGSQTITVNIVNAQTATISSLELNYTDGVTTETETFTGLSILPGSNQQLTFSVPYIINGNVSLYAYVSLVNGSLDDNQTNDTTNVQTICPAMAGSYTINSGAVTGGTNFQSFTDAVSQLMCGGISGPVVIDVTPGSGPYNEQIFIPEIIGASAVNTVTFNGNLETISFASANTSQRAVITLSGADHIIIDSLIIDASAGTYGFGVQLISQADSNIVSNCIVNGPANTTSTNFAGLVLSGSPTSATTTGNSGNGNEFSGNTINNFYYGITVVGTSASPFITNNKVLNNVVNDHYLYGLYSVGNTGTLIQGNEFKHSSRTTFTTMYGVFLTTNTIGAQVNGNTVHDFFAGGPSTSTAYGLYVAGDALLGSENKLINNLIYNFHGTGIHYGIYNTGGNHMWAWHNTVSFDNAAAASGTTYGIYQTTIADSLQYYNNNISITRAGTGTRYGIFFNTAGTHIKSNFNNIYVNTPGSDSVGYYAGTAFTTLLDWQTANSAAYDQQSVSAFSQFLDPSLGNYQPSVVSLDNVATPLGVTNDINGALRSLTTPDIGAYEYFLAPEDIGVTVLVTPTGASGICYTSNETVTLRIKNYGLNAIDFFVNPALITCNVTGAATATLTGIPTGILPINGTVDVVMSTTLDMSVIGAYTFNASVAMTGDGNANNDAMSPAIITTLPSVVGSTSASVEDICVSGTPTFTLTGSVGNIQWQTSTVDTTGPWTNVGTNSPTYIPSAPITQTTYFRVLVSCNASIDSSTVDSVVVNNPSIISSVGDTNCGPGILTLSAVGDGTSVNWFTSASGGSPVGSGNTFTTPLISSTTTYYAEASSGDLPATGGRLTNVAGSVLSGAPRGIIFDATEAVTIDSVGFLCSGIASAVTVQLYNSGGTATEGSPIVINIPANAGTSTVPVLLTFPVNIQVPAAGTYRLFVTSVVPTGNVLWYEFSGVTGYPYNVGTKVSITSSVTSLTGAASLTTYYYFYKLVVGSGCSGTRVPVVAEILSPPSVSVTSQDAALCGAGSTFLNVTSTNDPNYEYTWTSNPAGFTATGPGPHSVSPSVTTTYILSALDTSSGGTNGCINIDSVTVIYAPSLTPGIVSASVETYCFTGSPVVSVSGASGLIQWQESNVSSSGPWINVGTGSSTYSPGTITQNTYYRVLVSCQSGVDSSNVDSIIVNNPVILSTTGDTRCGPGVLTLQANTDPGVDVNWYTSPIGGSPVGSGNTFVTPFLTSTTDFYAEALVGDAPATGGRLTNVAGSVLSGSPRGIIFNATEAVTIDSVGLLCSGVASAVTVQLYNSGGTATEGAPVIINIPANSGTSTTPVLLTFPVNIAVPSAGTYRLFVTSIAPTGNVLWYEFSGVTGYPYNVGTKVSITSSVTSLTGAASLTTYYYFYKLVVGSGCVNPIRSAVQAELTPSPAVEISGDDTICFGDSTNLSVTLGLSDYTNFNWTPATGLSATSGTSIWAKPSVTTKYYLVANGNINNCQAIDSINVIVNDFALNVNVNNPMICGLSDSSQITTTATGGTFTYLWTPAIGLSSDTIANPKARPTGTSEVYTVIVTNTLTGCTKSRNVTIYKGSPSITSTVADTVCGTDQVNLGAASTAGSQISWWSAATGGTRLAVGSTFSPTISTTTKYYVEARDTIPQVPVSTGFGGGTTATDPNAAGNMFDITAVNNIRITGFDVHLDTVSSLQPSNIAIYYKSGSYAGFTTNASAWTLAGTASGVVSAGRGVATSVPVNLDIPVNAGQTYGFYIVVTNLGVANSLIYSASAISPTEFTVASSDFNMQVKSGTVIFGPFTGQVAAPLNRLWNGNVKYSIGCISGRDSVEAVSLAAPAISLTTTPNDTICTGSSVTLQASSVNDPNYSYQWNPGALPGASAVVTPSAKTKYYVTATDTSSGASGGCIVVDSVTINLFALPVVNATATPSLVCAGTPSQLASNALGATPESDSLATGLVDNNGSSLVGFDIVNNSSQPIVINNFSFRSNIAAGTNIPVTVLYNATPLNCVIPTGFTTLPPGWVSLGVSNAVAAGPAPALTYVPLNLNITIPPGATYAFALGSSTASTIRYTDGVAGCPNIISDGNITIKSGFGGSFTGSTIASRNFAGRVSYTVPAIGTLNYSWTPATGLSSSSVANPVATPTISTDYIVTVTNADNGCTMSDTVSVTVNPLAQPFISTNDTTLCSPNFVYVNVDDAGIYSGGYPSGTQFEWLSVGGQIVPPTPDLDTIPSTFGSTYYAIITLPNGCTAISDTATILTKAVAIVDTITNATCTGGGSILATVTSGIAPYNYVWSTDLAQTNIIRNVTSSVNKDTLSGLAAGTYYLSVSDEFGNPGSCNSGVIAYVVTGSNPIVATATGTDITCNGFGDGSASVSWTGGTAPFSVLWSDGNTNTTRPVLTTTTLTVIVSDLSGCADTASVTVNEPSAISLSLSSTNESAPAANDGTVSVVVSGGTPGYLIDWYDAGFVQIGSGSPLGGLTGGVYTCLVTDANGCQGFDNVTVNTNTNVTLNLTMLIEGMYDGVGGLVPALLNSGVGVSTTECDTIIVEIRDQVSPTTILATGTAVLGTNGQASFTFPASISGATGYIAVFHRNAVQTWSDLVTFSGVTNYNFTTAATQAFSSNQREVSPGVWAMYSGDLAPQDEFIDILDQSVIDNDIFNFAGGYVVSDLNGDGFVDIVDQSIVDNNIFNFIGSIHP